MQTESYLYSCCHCSSCCQIQPLPSKIHHGLIASFFGLYDVLVNLLKAKHTEILEGCAWESHNPTLLFSINKGRQKKSLRNYLMGQLLLPLYTHVSFTYPLSFKKGLCLVKQEDKIDHFCPAQKHCSYIASSLQSISLTCQTKVLQEITCLRWNQRVPQKGRDSSQRTSEARALT